MEDITRSAPFRQYSGILGQIGNCQIGVSVHAAADAASCPLNWRLFVPEALGRYLRGDERDRRLHRSPAGAGGDPDTVRHRTKWSQALEMIDEAAVWGLTPPVVVADAGYGEITAFRQGLTGRGFRYVLAVKASTSAHRPMRCPDPHPTADGDPAARTGTGTPPDRKYLHIVHETIYQALYIRGRGGLSRELVKCLRTGRDRRKPNRSIARRSSRFAGEVLMISDRPEAAGDRSVPGAWEGDLVVGTQNRTAIATLVERSTRYLLLVHMPGNNRAEDLRDGLVKALAPLPAALRTSLTWDPGLWTWACNRCGGSLIFRGFCSVTILFSCPRCEIIRV
ncbi:IS30 family transposase [Pseudarthrobacter sp. S9]|uniref:IS30 family transposase n=1 Tax=Pseudarthrobacter sp. S9 TaxID=3418421 RepID=UPI003CFC9944